MRRKHRVVAEPHRARAINRLEEGPNRVPRQRPWELLTAIHARRVDLRVEPVGISPWDLAGRGEEPKEGSEVAHHMLYVDRASEHAGVPRDCAVPFPQEVPAVNRVDPQQRKQLGSHARAVDVLRRSRTKVRVEQKIPAPAVRICLHGRLWKTKGGKSSVSGLLPPLDSLRFFEAAARHQSFARAATELGFTAAAVGHHVRLLEKHLDVPLFDRRQRGVRLNHRGQIYLKEVQRILADIQRASERQRRLPRRVRIISVEAIAEMWLVPRLAAFKAAHPGIAVEIETNHRGVDPNHRDFDAWFAYAGETAPPRPVPRREDTLLEETLYEEQLLPVCSPILLAARGWPRRPADLDDWPLLYDLGWDTDWSYWFARQGESTPDLSRASGFRLYSMLIQAAVNGIGVAVGRDVLIARELQRRTLVPIFARQAEAPERCCLITTAAARHRPEVQEFREWVLREAETTRRIAASPSAAVRGPEATRSGVPESPPGRRTNTQRASDSRNPSRSASET